MAVIERWECPEHGADSGPGKRCGRMARPYVLCHREKVKVEYVPRDEAAVERGAERIDDLLLQLGVEPTYAPDHAPSETIKRVLARAVLNGAGEPTT